MEHSYRDHPATTDRQSLQVLKALVFAIQPKRILEIGTAFGISAWEMSQVAPFAQIETVEKDEFMVKIARDTLRGTRRAMVIQDDSQKVPVLLPPGPNEGVYDFIYIDGGEETRDKDMLRFRPFLRPGGIMVVHDCKEPFEVKRRIIAALAAMKLPGYEVDTKGGLLIVRA
jgi:predicted O-methyltransferase YrrM